MITRMDKEQFDKAGTTSVLGLIDRWHDDITQQLASFGCKEEGLT